MTEMVDTVLVELHDLPRKITDPNWLESWTTKRTFRRLHVLSDM